MKLSDTFLTATQNLGRRKVRTVLTSIGVFVGILTVVTMVSLGIGIQKQVTDTIEQLGLETIFVSPQAQSQPEGTFNPAARQRPEKPINNEALAQIQKMDGVSTIEVFLSLPSITDLALTIDGKTYRISIPDRSPQSRLFNPANTAPLVGKELENTPDERGLVLNAKFLQNSGYTQSQYAGLVGKAASLTVTAPRGDQQTFPITVIGVVAANEDNMLGNADKLDVKKWWYNDPNILESDGYAAAVVHTNSLNDATRVSKQISDMGLGSATLQTFLDQVNRIFSILQVMLSSVGLLALLVASIGIANTMIMAIYERTREIGTLKALGSSNGDILRMFMVEAGLIGLFGGIVGVISGWLLGLLLNRIIIDYMKQQQIPLDAPFFVVTWQLVGGALLFATLIGILAGLYPSLRAARLDPLTALRHE